MRSQHAFIPVASEAGKCADPDALRPGALRDRWLLVACVALLTLAATAVYTVSITPQYQSTARLFVKTPQKEGAPQRN